MSAWCPCVRARAGVGEVCGSGYSMLKPRASLSRMPLVCASMSADPQPFRGILIVSDCQHALRTLVRLSRDARSFRGTTLFDLCGHYYGIARCTCGKLEMSWKHVRFSSLARLSLAPETLENPVWLPITSNNPSATPRKVCDFMPMRILAASAVVSVAPLSALHLL